MNRGRLYLYRIKIYLEIYMPQIQELFIEYILNIVMKVA